MKAQKTTTVTVALMIAISSLAAINARAGDKEWATAGKILTGVIAGGVLVKALESSACSDVTVASGPVIARPLVCEYSQPVYVVSAPPPATVVVQTPQQVVIQQQETIQQQQQQQTTVTVPAQTSVVVQQPVVVQTVPVVVRQPVYTPIVIQPCVRPMIIHHRPVSGFSFHCWYRW